MEKKMNVAATFRLREVNVAAGLEPTKLKGHSERHFRAKSYEESSTSQIPSSQRRFSPLTKGESERDFLKSETPPQSSPEMGGNFSSYQEGQGEVSSTPLLSGEAGRGYESTTATPEFIPQNGTQAIYFYHWDHLGTVRMVTNSSGEVVSRHDFEPYGLELPGSNTTAGNTHQFTGQERDALSGLDFMHFRYYGSTMGRFIRPDNILGDLNNPQSFNRYSYVKGNPVNFNDPTGHMPPTDHTTAGTAAIPKDNGEPPDLGVGSIYEDIPDNNQKKVNVQEIIKALSTSGQIGSFKVTSDVQQALQNNPAFKQGFEMWLTTESGSKQFEQMSNDKNTLYTMEMSSNIGGRGETKATFFSENPGPTRDYKGVFIMLHSDLSKTTDSFSLAVTIGHEAFHVEALGSGKYTAIGSAKINKQLDLDRDSSDIGLGYWKMK